MPLLLCCLLLLACSGTDKADPPGDGPPEDLDHDGVPAADDCDDTSSAISPRAAEVCDGLDNDCDGQVDDDPVEGATSWPDLDGDGYGDAGAAGASCEAHPDDPSYVTQAGDCDDASAVTYPGAAELCDGADNDCDDATDEGADDAPWVYPDADGDGAGAPDNPIPAACTAEGYSPTADDCDDTDASTYPGAIEGCDGEDHDCDPDTTRGVGVVYVDPDGHLEDMTEVVAAGTERSPVSLEADGGTWSICGGPHYVHFDVKGSTRFEGSAPETDILDGGTRSSILQITGEGATVTVSGLTLQNGEGRTDTHYEHLGGGGISCVGGNTLLVEQVTLQGNGADIGAAIWVDGCSVTLDSLIVQDNTATWGGGLYMVAGDATITNSTFSGNTAITSGGALGVEPYDGADATLTLQDSEVRDNSATYGGGLVLFNGAYATVRGSDALDAGFYGNRATSSGGGLYASSFDGVLFLFAVDFGASADANAPSDAEVNDEVYQDLGADATLYCTSSGCI